MAVAVTTETVSIGSPTPKLKITSNIPSPNHFSFMVWFYHTGTGADAYQDFLGITDTNEVVGGNLHLVSGNRHISIGDLNTDNDGATIVPDNEWHHFAMTVADVTGAGTQCWAYLDGRLEIGPASLVNPTTPTAFQVWNSRASDTDAGAVFVGRMYALKCWYGVNLGADEIRREMFYNVPQRTQNLYAWSPFIDADHRTYIFDGRAGVNWTSQSSIWTTGADPPCVLWDNPLRRRKASRFYLPVVYEQEGYRWRADDGSESAATWLAAQDTSIVRATLTATRLRSIVNMIADPSGQTFQLEYRKSGNTAWHKVGE